MKKQIYYLLAALMFVSCGKGTSNTNEEAKADSLTAYDETEEPVKADGGTYSVANILKYEEFFNNDYSAEFTDEELEEMDSWVDDKMPYFVEETDKLLNAVDEYTLRKHGEKYFPCTWEEGFNPAGIPEVEIWAKRMMNIDGINFGAIINLLAANKKRNIYEDRYDSKENYYLSRFRGLTQSGAPDLGSFFDGLIFLHRGECTLSQQKEADEWVKEYC